MIAPLKEEKHWTYEEYRRLPDDGNRYEIVDGRLLVKPAPRTFHQTISRRLQFLIYGLERSGKGYIFNAPVEVIMPGASPVQPDLVYLTAEQKGLIVEKSIEGVPHLLIEILSPSTASVDRTLKLNTYTRAGVPNYWIVDPEAKTLEVYHLRDDAYSVAAALDEFSTYCATELENLEVPLEEVFASI